MLLVSIIGCIIFIIMVFLIHVKAKPRAKRTPIHARSVITAYEQTTFLRLKEALPDHHVLAQVAFSAFLTAQGYATRNLFNRKRADFVILDQKFNCIAIIELDDSSHRNTQYLDQKRDDMIQEAGLRVIRYRKTPQISQIRRDILSIDVKQ